jgi:hypothetical protein
MAVCKPANAGNWISTNHASPHRGVFQQAVLGRDISLADARFKHLSDAGILAHRVLAPLRWLLFLFPTVIPVVYAAYFTEVWKVYPFSVLFALDCIIIAVLLLVMAAAAREQAAWRRRHGGSPAVPTQGSTPR